MKYLYLLFLTVVVGCGSSDANGVPDCVIDVAKSNGSVAIYSWTATDSKQYYIIQSDCCDQIDELYDADCNFICAPSGGFTGGGDGLCPTTIMEGERGTEPLWTK